VSLTRRPRWLRPRAVGDRVLALAARRPLPGRQNPRQDAIWAEDHGSPPGPGHRRPAPGWSHRHHRSHPMGQSLHGPAVHHPRPHFMILKRPTRYPGPSSSPCDPLVSPARVLPCQLLNQHREPGIGRRPADPVGIGPVPRTNHRCQRSSVSGVTSRLIRSDCGSSQAKGGEYRPAGRVQLGLGYWPGLCALDLTGCRLWPALAAAAARRYTRPLHLVRPRCRPWLRFRATTDPERLGFAPVPRGRETSVGP
jgi:hypothetical protein